MLIGKKVVSLIAGLLLTASAVFADSVEGYWTSVDDKTGQATAGWQIWEEGGKLYGKILSVANPNEDPTAFGAKGKNKKYPDFQNGVDVSTLNVVGTTWIYGLTKKAEGQWQKGSIIDPGDGSKYNCKITFHKADGKKYKVDTLEMRGEIGLGIGRSQYWRISTQEEASSLK